MAWDSKHPSNEESPAAIGITHCLKGRDSQSFHLSTRTYSEGHAHLLQGTPRNVQHSKTLFLPRLPFATITGCSWRAGLLLLRLLDFIDSSNNRRRKKCTACFNNVCTTLQRTKGGAIHATRLTCVMDTGASLGLTHPQTINTTSQMSPKEAFHLRNDQSESTQ